MSIEAFEVIASGMVPPFQGPRESTALMDSPGCQREEAELHLMLSHLFDRVAELSRFSARCLAGRALDREGIERVRYGVQLIGEAIDQARKDRLEFLQRRYDQRARREAK